MRDIDTIIENMEDYIKNFDIILKNTREGIAILNIQAEIVKLNKKAKDILKDKFSEDLKKDFKIKEILQGDIDEYKQKIKSKQTIVDVYIKPMIYHESIIGAIIFMNENINYDKVIKKLECSKKYINELEIILERTYDGVVAVNKEGIITLISKSYAEYLGVNQAEVVGKHVTNVIDNTRMHIVVRSGEIESTQLQKINNKYIITTRIPIKENGQVVGAVANVLFRDTKNYNLFYKHISKIEEKFQNKEEKQISQAVYTFDSIVGKSDIIEKTKCLAKKAAHTKSSVLLKGESGTGKELFAHSIHNDSKRRHKNFIKVNCAAIPNELLESELFGYEKGSFTGAKTEGKVGKFELADGGTIFLDEIGDMPLNMQAKLLRVIQEREVEKIGSNTAKEIDIRIISATNRDLESMVNKGEFRKDLYYRLNVVEVNIPSLREREKDIPFLIDFLIKKLCEKLDKRISGICNKAVELLKGYRWEGNVRQLENVIERAINIVEDGEKILVEHFPENITGVVIPNDKVESLDNIVNEAEKHAIVNSLIICNGNKSKAARRLNISRSTLYEKMSKHNIQM